MEKAPTSLRTLIASGDVYIRAGQPLQDIPDVDVVCYGLWVDPNLAKNHGKNWITGAKLRTFLFQNKYTDANSLVPDGYRYLVAE